MVNIILIIELALALGIIVVNAFYDKELEKGLKIREDGMAAITRLNTHLVDLLNRQQKMFDDSKYFVVEDVLKELLAESNTKTDEKSMRRAIMRVKEKQELKG